MQGQTGWGGFHLLNLMLIYIIIKMLSLITWVSFWYKVLKISILKCWHWCVCSSVCLGGEVWSQDFIIFFLSHTLCVGYWSTHLFCQGAFSKLKCGEIFCVFFKSHTLLWNISAWHCVLNTPCSAPWRWWCPYTWPGWLWWDWLLSYSPCP